jgi:hypothetical protein
VYKLEEYTIKDSTGGLYYPYNVTVRLYTNGEYRCSCRHFKPSGYVECRHIYAIRKNNTTSRVQMIGAKRFSENEKYIK